MTTFRIFISSPGDVVEEREKARLVIDQLARHYRGEIELLPVLWEDLPLQADCSFQEGIDLVLSQEHGIDIAVFILWCRLGSPLGSMIRRPDGSLYRSGTERELEMMLEARRNSKGWRPAILAYTRHDPQGFLDRLKGEDTALLEEAIRQRKLAEEFIFEYFHDAEGHNIRAYHTFAEPVTFASRLRVHLRQIIDEALGQATSAALWTQPPYQGLAIFDLEHAAIFRGREEEICELGLLLRRRAEQQRCAFVVVVGSSGSGKSSLVRAGLAVSLLEENVDTAVRQWRYALMTPSGGEGDPFLALARALLSPRALPDLQTGQTSLGDLTESFREAPKQALSLALSPALAQARQRAGGTVRLLLIVDQIEELFTDRRIAPTVRRQFLELLELLAQLGSVSVVATLRSDFFPQFQKEDVFLRLKGMDGQFDLLPPQLPALRRIILEPAQLAGLRFQQHPILNRSLDEQLLADAAQLADALPLVEFALRELYEKHSEKMLTFTAYEQMGGVEGAIGSRAEEVFSHLPKPAQSAFPAVFRRLLTMENAAVARRWVPHKEVIRTPEEEILVGTFITERFFTAATDGEKATVAITHEVLLRSWPRLVEFVNANRDALSIRARLEQAHTHWLEQRNDSSLLLQSGLPLLEAENLLAKMPEIVPESLVNYVVASHKHCQAQLRRRRHQRLLLIGLALLALFGGTAAWVQQRETAAEQRRAAALYQVHQGELHLGHGEWPAALRLYSDAYATNPDYTTRSALLRGLSTLDPRLRQSFHEHTAAVRALDFNPQGLLISGDQAGAVRVLDPDQGTCLRRMEPLTPESKNTFVDVKTLRWSVDNRALMVLGDGRIVVLQSGEQALQITGTRMPCEVGESCEVEAAAFSPQGDRVAVSHAERSTAQVLVLTPGDPPENIESPAGRITAFAFSPDNRKLAYGTERGGVFLRESGATERMIRPPADHPTNHRVTVLAWGPSSVEQLAVGDVEGIIELLPLRAQGASLLLPPHPGPVTAVAWNPQQARLASASGRLVRVLDVHPNSAEVSPFEEPIYLRGHLGSVLTVAWSDNGTMLASGGDDNTVHVWALDSAAPPLTVWKGPGHPLHGLAISGDGALIAAGAENGEICVWSAAERRLLNCLRGGHNATVNALAWHPSEPLLISGDEEGVIQGWKWPDTQPFALGDTPGDSLRHDGPVWTLQWFSNGQLLASAGHDRKVKVWHRAENRPFTFAELPDFALGLAISSDQSLLASASTNGRIWVWKNPGISLRPPDLVLPVSSTDAGHRSSVGGLAFSHDSRVLASAGNDGTVRLWDLETGRTEAVSPSIGSYIEAVAFSPDDTFLVSVGADGQFRAWSRTSLEPFLALQTHNQHAWNLAWLPEPKAFISASSDGTLCSFAWSEKQWMARLHQVLGLPPGKPLSAGGNGAFWRRLTNLLK